jgi:muramoyltetrapeptide carboxypeptidase
MDNSLVRRAVENISRRGYEVKLSNGYLQRRGYLAADDKTRAAELNAFFLDKSVKAILCLRGGYGSPRILDRLDYDAIRQNPKIFIGYSDITALLNGIHTKTGLVSFHGPMAKEFSIGKGLTPYTEKYFWPAFTPESKLFADWGGAGPKGRSHLKTLAGGKAEGVLVGGNLSVLTCTIGTPYEARSRDCILFLEDVSETPFRIDRMLNQLRLSGMLGRYKGVILGSFTGCLPLRGSGIGLLDVFDHYFEKLGVPVLSGYAAGHQPDQATLPIGARVRLDATAKKVSLIETPVATAP